MLDWHFNEFECLPLLVTLLVDENVSKSNDLLDELYCTDPEFMAKSLWEYDEILPLMERILSSIDAKEMVTAEQYNQDQIDRRNFSNLYLEPVSFFKWCEAKGYKVNYNVSQAVADRIADFRVQEFADYTISKAEVVEKLREPLWFSNDAIMYLFGFEPPKDKGRFGSRSLSDRIVASHDGMSSIDRFLRDANAIGDIQLFKDSTHSCKVKPKDFMRWAQGLNIKFPNLIVPDEKQTQTALHSKEKETLLKLLLGLALTNYEYNPLASRNSTAKEIAGDLGLQGLAIDEDTVRKWLNEAKELLPQDWQSSR